MQPPFGRFSWPSTVESVPATTFRIHRLDRAIFLTMVQACFSEMKKKTGRKIRSWRMRFR